MNLTISKENLMNGLQAVQNVISTRTTLPVLWNVLLKAAAGRLMLAGTDLDVLVSCEVEADVKKEGSSTLPAKRFFAVVRELAGEEIEIQVDEKNIFSVKCGSSFYRINGISSEEFPPIASLKKEKKLSIEQKKLKSMLRKTSFAVSTDESRYVLNGIFFSLREQKLTLVATDGRRLALVDEEVEVDEKNESEFIVPSKAISELLRLIGDSGEVEIVHTQNQASFSLNNGKESNVVVLTKLIDGNYPNYKQVIPSETKERIRLDREEFLHAVRRAEIMTSDKSNSVKLTFSKNNLTISANSPDVGEAIESIAINYKGKDFSIAFNPRYLIEPLNALDEQEIFLELTDELSPGLMKINGPFLYVVMPMRLA